VTFGSATLRCVTQGEINALKLNHWLQQPKFYFSVDHIDEGCKISFARLKSKGHALT
jgi:hypothetical protein